MITYRSEKAYDLTHEELDENFRSFDNDNADIVGTDIYCPEGDKYIYDIAYITDRNYVLFGASPSQYGVMGSTPISVPFTALLDATAKINHNGSITPTDIAGFSLLDTVNAELPINQNQQIESFDIEFSEFVDLIEIESDITTASINYETSIPYNDGYLVGSIGSLTTGVDYVAYDFGELGFVDFQVSSTTPVTIPTSWNDLDPFGDGSQVHFFKFEGNLIDEMSNGTISGSASYTPESWEGSQGLLCKNNNSLDSILLSYQVYL